MSDDIKNEDELKDILERAASRVLQEKLGVELNEDGKVKSEDIDQDAVQANLKPIAMSMIAAIGKELKQAGRWPSDTTTKNPPPADGVQTELVVEGEVPESSDREPTIAEQEAQAFIQDWGDSMTRKLSNALNDKLGVPLAADGVVDIDRLENPDVQRNLTERLSALFNAVGRTVEDLRSQVVQFQPEAVPLRPADTDDSEPDTGAEEASVEVEPNAASEEGAETDEKAADERENVLDFDQWKQRIEDRKNSVFELGGSLQESIGRFIEAQLTDVGADGNMNLNLNQDFFKEHGPAILKQAWDEITKSFVPPKIEVNLPMAETGQEPAQSVADAEQSEDDTGGVKLKVNLDLASLFGKLFKPKDEEADE